MMIKRLILTVYLAGVILCANENNTSTALSYDASVSLLKSLDDEAIELGNGAKELYVFLDPLCLHSRKFVMMVSQNPKMLSKYRYRFFLYSIARLKSQEVVAAIYASPKPLKTLLEVKEYHTKVNPSVQSKVDAIASVAQKMDVHKRPYVFVVK